MLHSIKMARGRQNIGRRTNNTRKVKRQRMNESAEEQTQQNERARKRMSQLRAKFIYRVNKM